jgi:lipopolysaccharide biosynthesis protein
MTTLTARLRAAVYLALRTGFRALPLSDGQRDRLRGRFMDRHADWVPPPPRGRVDAAGDGSARRPLVRADEAAIGHVPYRAEPLPETLPATLIAFYLPQFHPIAQNDAWWGKGFTEWRNVSRALPQFEGHVQPRLPADLGFYDLRNPQVMRDQVALAREYGIGAFCFYYYWFSGTTLLESPLRQWLADDSIELPFCLCWANENWARRWDGRGDDILIGQEHSAEDDIAFIAHVADYLRDRRALKVDGKPMLLVYRPHLLPDARATAQRWRQWCREHDIGEIHLAYVQGFERPDPRDIDFDAAVEFPPNMSNPRSLTAEQYLINPDFHGDVRDWRELASEIGARALPDYPLYPGVNPGWDNEARRSGRGRVYLHASPRGYRDWLSTTIHQRLAAVPPDQRLVFINAWNEWAEGAVLEPDMRLGHAYLEATRQALHAPQADRAPSRPCAVVHAVDARVLSEQLAVLRAARQAWRIIVATTASMRATMEQVAQQTGVAVEIEVVADNGTDVLSFLQVAERLYAEGEQVLLTVCCSAPPNAPAPIDNALAASAGRVFQAFMQEPELGLVTLGTPTLSPADAGGRDLGAMRARIGLAPAGTDDASLRTTSPLWVRLSALRPMLDAHLPRSLLAVAPGSGECAQARAVLALVPEVVRHTGARVRTLDELPG